MKRRKKRITSFSHYKASYPKFQFSILFLFLLLLILTFHLTLSKQLFKNWIDTRPAGKVDSTEVNTILKNLTLKQKVGQLFFTYASGDFTNEESDEYKRLKRSILEDHIGGLIFFSGNVYGQAMLTNKLQKISRIPLWITEDMEFGPAMRIQGSTRFSPAMGIAATGNPYYAYQVGRITAYEAKALGVDQIFAPDIDVNNNPDNPIINVRSFSSDARTVAAYGTAYMHGVLDEGLVPTAKHFPGHGDTHIDSHLQLPVSRFGYTRLDTLELVPFRKLIDNGVPSIMSAHIAFPKISGKKALPGTLDPDILNKLLKDTLKFHGLVITDALRMDGITNHYSPGKAAVMAIQAGADILLLSPDQYTAIHDVIDAVKSGKISEKRIDQSVRKILLWKIRRGLFQKDQVNLNELDQKIHTKDHVLLSRKIARKSVTVLKNRHHILPIEPHRYPRILVVAMSDDEDGNTGKELASMMREYHPTVTFRLYDKRTCRSDLNRIIREASNYSLIVVGSFVHVKTASKIQLSDEQIHFLKRLEAQHRPLALIAFGNPYVVRDLPDADVQVCAWSASNNQVEQTVPALFGASEINGKLPIDIPPHYKRGFGIHIPKTILRTDDPEVAGLSSDSLYHVEQIMRRAIRDSVFPGGVVAVVKNGILAYNKGFGYQTYKKLKHIDKNDVYDLASLTKVVATTASIMKLYDEGKLDLNAHLSQYFKAFDKGPKKKITVSDLLTHTSGFPPDFPMSYLGRFHGRKALTKAAMEVPLINPPGTKYVYSDINFITLGALVRKISGMSLDKFAYHNIYFPLDMHYTMFNPLKHGRWLLKLIPPTEIDTTLRHKIIHGQVNDERSYYMGGIAGHAGLFSTSHDLAAFAQLLLNKGTYEGTLIYTPQTVSLFTKKESDISNRGYGFDLKSPEGFSTAGKLMDNRTFGHLGFTGTSLWIDPTRNLAIIILTNREYPHRKGSKGINHVRAKVADAVVRSIIEKER